MSVIKLTRCCISHILPLPDEDEILRIPESWASGRHWSVPSARNAYPQCDEKNRSLNMKHFRYVTARLLGKTRMGGLYTYWDIAN
ncbi:hypothetical protein [Amycolatopsis sp. cmx-11-12]|uniref:hypothetical protein n=1 Tax=Amycolatopsis sp. cmx-11-12 TaxID=2785795 RepID=UPI003917CE4C